MVLPVEHYLVPEKNRIFFKEVESDKNPSEDACEKIILSILENADKDDKPVQALAQRVKESKEGVKIVKPRFVPQNRWESFLHMLELQKKR